MLFEKNSHLRICLLILEREEGKEREKNGRERNINRLPLVFTATGCRAHNLSMGPNRGSNPQPFSVWDDATTN